MVNPQVTHSLVPQERGVNRKGHPMQWEPHKKIHILDDREYQFLSSHIETLQISAPRRNQILKHEILRLPQWKVEEPKPTAGCQVSSNAQLLSHRLP